MQQICRFITISLLFETVVAASAAPPPSSQAAKQEARQLDSLPALKPGGSRHIDHSGRKQEGNASYYSRGFSNKKMADGRRMNPEANIAASKTLPLGSVAEVTNLKNGKSTTVKVEDRGPYVGSRIIDLTPKAASQIQLQRSGVAPVVVKPIAVPTGDGGVRLGAGAAQADPQSVTSAVETAQQLTAPVEASR